MIATKKITPLRYLDVYEGVSKSTGEPYKIGTWRIKTLDDNKEMVVKAFTAIHDQLMSKIDIAIDVGITISLIEWKGKFYNDIYITKIEESVQPQDVPSMVVDVDKPLFNNGESWGEPNSEENPLPF